MNLNSKTLIELLHMESIIITGVRYTRLNEYSIRILYIIDHTIDQFFDHTIDQFFDHSIDYNLDQFFDHSIDHSIDHPIDHSVKDTNITQLSTFKDRRNLMLKKLFRKDKNKAFTKVYDNTSHLFPKFCTSIHNSLNLWNNFMAIHTDKFNVKNNIINFLKSDEYNIDELIIDLYSFLGLEPLCLEKLTNDYNKLLEH